MHLQEDKMKKLIILVVCLFFAFIIYHDIAKGTLPITATTASAPVYKSTEKATKKTKNASYVTVKIQPGDTVLSIIEEVNKDTRSIPMQRIISDFSGLNKQTTPDKIQVGKTYKFPIYSK